MGTQALWGPLGDVVFRAVQHELLTFGLVLCWSLLSSRSRWSRSNSSRISAGVLFLSTTCEHTRWVTYAGSHTLGHTRWVTHAGSHTFTHSCLHVYSAFIQSTLQLMSLSLIHSLDRETSWSSSVSPQRQNTEAKGLPVMKQI